ncbi:MAG: error-prone DNA polymerase, partial [Gammaproteobacteria bacterium]
RAALAATVIRYRPRSAMRDVGKALGLTDIQVDTLAKSLQWWEGPILDPTRVVEAGLDPSSPLLERLLRRVTEILDFPRHLSQHVGGFVISQGDLCELVPVENAAMPERTVIQWDKDDLEDLGLLKVDVLGLGMLSAIRRSLELLQQVHGSAPTMATIPAEDQQVYDMICKADTMGVFQIESRAQMTMLPRLKPRCYYDLVIEVAIIRPGPIQGDMVHPYLRRRNGEEAVTYPSIDVENVLRRTLGVPIFQEQVMQLAMVAAGFTAGEADQLRRAMAAWKRRGGLDVFEDRLLNGMEARGYPRQFATQIFNQIKGFGEYGFPESHSASFALLVYVSAWLKHYHPAIFCCALLNSQPMGFYAPAQLIRNAREHGVEVHAADINYSDYESTIEKDAAGQPCLRLGLRLIKNLSQNGIDRLVAERRHGPFTTVQSMAERCQLNSRDMGAFAAAGALASITGNRHLARWQVAGVQPASPLLPTIQIPEATPLLRPPGEADDLVADYRQMGLSLGRHPLALLRQRLRKRGVVTADGLATIVTGRRVYVAGLVINRQRPSSAAGVTFVTLEDETGYVNLIVWQRTAESQRRALLGASLLGVHGEVQQEQGVIHVVAERLEDHSALLGKLTTRSRDFR